MAHALAGKPVQEQDIIDVQTIVDAYFDNVPDMTNPTQLHKPFVMVVNNLVLLVRYS